MKHREAFKKWFSKYQPVKDQDYYDLLSEPYYAGYSQAVKDMESRRCENCKYLRLSGSEKDKICGKCYRYTIEIYDNWEPKKEGEE